MHRILPSLLISILASGSLHAQSLSIVPPPASGFSASVFVLDGNLFVSRTGAEIRMATNPQAGFVQVFERDGAGEWGTDREIAAAAGTVGDQFGASLASDGVTMVVGAPGAAEASGVVYVFERGGASWVERASLDPGAQSMAGAGTAVAVTSTAILVGAPGGLGDLTGLGQPAAPQPGIVYAYAETADGDWSLAQRLESPDPSGTDRFGRALLAIDDQLFVGAPGAAGGAGAVYHFELGGRGWQLRQSLSLEDGATGDRLGASLAVDDGRLYAGAPGHDGAGAVAVFAYEDDWRLTRKLTAPDPANGAGFGSSVAAGTETIWVGAPRASGAVGATFLFDSNGLRPAQTLEADDFGPGAAFGSSVAVNSGVAIVGAGQADLRLGAAAVFERTAGAREWTRTQTLRDPGRNAMAAVAGETVTCEEGTAGDYECADVDLLSFTPLDQLGAGPASIANDIWGWVDPVTGREYALLGKSNGTSFVDITNPERPVYVGELPLTDGANENLWRDIKTYADHAFIVADGAGAHGVQIFDLTQLRDVRRPPRTFEETAHYDGIFSSHNIVINEETGFAHAVGSSGGGEPCGGGLHMIDIRDPKSPTFVGCFADPSTGGFLGKGYTHDAQCVIYRGPDADYVDREICFHSSIDALGISDISDKDNPVGIARADYPGAVAAHQGWLSEDHRYFFMGDELDEEAQTVGNTRTLVWDIAELDDPILVTQYYAETRAIDHNQYVRGRYLYQSNLMSGLRILDISDPENPVEVAFFDTVPYDDDLTAFGGSWSNYPFFPSGAIVVSSWNEGLFVLKKREPELVP